MTTGSYCVFLDPALVNLAAVAVVAWFRHLILIFNKNEHAAEHHALAFLW